MLIKALCDYADMMESIGENTVPVGWCKQPVSLRIMLNTDGTIAEIVDIREEVTYTDKKGKEKTEKKPVEIVLPIRTQKTSIDSNIIEHRSLYIFGLNYEKGSFTTDDKTNKAKKSHEAFVKFNDEFFDGLESEICKAYRLFLKNWIPAEETENAALKQFAKEYKGSYFAFGLNGFKANLEEDEDFVRRYNEYYSSQKSEPSDNDKAICGILGERLVPARIHGKIKFPGGNSSGCVLVGMNEDAFESYGKSQSFNSNISEAAMKKYTVALNSLLADKNHRIIMDELVTVFFAIKNDDSNEAALFSMMMGGSFDNIDANLTSLYKNAKRGIVGNLDAFKADPDVTFYVVGMTPNSSRISQRFIYRDKFGKIISNLNQHQMDLQINPDSDRQIYFSAIKNELTSPKSTQEKIPPSLMSSIMLAAMNGTAYPRTLLSTVIRRVRTDSNDPDKKLNHIKLNDTRAGIIKACINRKSRLEHKKEEFTMSLDKENRNPAYLCGRLFAVLEKIQQDASGGKLNRTIKDSYFSSACTRPSCVLPKLVMLSQNHIKKLSEGSAVYYQKLTGEIMSGLEDRFPQTLSLEAQGSFIIGYYQQNKVLFTKNESKNTND